MSMVKREQGRRFWSKDRFYSENEAFMVKKIGILALRGKDPWGN